MRLFKKLFLLWWTTYYDMRCALSVRYAKMDRVIREWASSSQKADREVR